MIILLLGVMVIILVVIALLVWWIIRMDRAVDPRTVLSEPLQRLEDATVSMETVTSKLQQELEIIRATPRSRR